MAWVEQMGTQSWRVRYPSDSGSTGSLKGFRSRKSAQDYAALLEARRRRGTWVDPVAGRITVAEWAVVWWPTITNIAERTAENYHRRLNRHVLPRWGRSRLCDITPAQLTAWAQDLSAAGYARSTISSLIKLLSMMLIDAVDARLIEANPVAQRRHRGRRQHHELTERIWTTPERAVRIAEQAGVLGGPDARLMVITAAWTGARWGELSGLQPHNAHLDPSRGKGFFVIDPRIGSLHESGTRLWLDAPKTSASARRISLPPFLVALLHEHLATFDSGTARPVFASPEGDWLRRSNFARRVLRPATDGNLHVTQPRIRSVPVELGLTFHGFRHSHKTWLIADGMPEIAQARRLGHHLDNRVVETYSHVAPEVEHRLLDALERRWHDAIAASEIEALSTWLVT